ncbi:MAG: SurA N-terminal domain-containing protein [Bdellovibrionales bacterium]|nr:SurA N-terminal domain-containing protein [Bdellovibrionales bacterium]
MLEKLRQPYRAKGLLTYIIFGAIIIVFIGFGVVPSSRHQTTSNAIAAVVNQSQIPVVEFKERLNMLEQQYQFRFDQFPEAQRETMLQMMKQRVLEQLIEYEVLYQAAYQKGIRATDEEVKKFIIEVPSFQEKGQFKREFYNRFLESRAFTASQFEDKIRKDVVVQKLQKLFGHTFQPSDIEKSLSQKVSNTKLNLSVASFTMEDLTKNFKITEGEIKTFLISPENIKKVQKNYEDNKIQYTEPEQVKASHILIKVDPNQPTSSNTAEKKIKDLAVRAQKEDFAKLAKEFSEDPGSKAKNGDLGYFSKGRMLPEFETMAFTTPVGKISAPVKTDFGYHIIKVIDHKASHLKPLEQVKSEIAQKLISQEKSETLIKELRQKVSKSDEKGTSATLNQLKITWVDTGEFSLDTPQIPKINDSSDTVIETIINKGISKGLVPEIITAGGKNWIIKVKSLQTSPGKTEGTPELNDLDSARYADAFKAWSKIATEQSVITRNGQL